MSEGISVEDRLPNDDSEIVIYGIPFGETAKRVHAGRYSHLWKEFMVGPSVTKAVACWQPLPPPPEATP